MLSFVLLVALLAACGSGSSEPPAQAEPTAAGTTAVATSAGLAPVVVATNTYIPLILPHFFGTPFFIFMMVQFIRGIPVELDEAAEIDGCSRVGIFFRIILPLIKPALITSAIFAFYWSWDDFLTPLIYLNDPNLYTISLALRSFADPSSVTNWGGVFAMGVLALIPVFTLFIVFQKYLVEGISTTGLKG